MVATPSVCITVHSLQLEDTAVAAVRDTEGAEVWLSVDLLGLGDAAHGAPAHAEAAQSCTPSMTSAGPSSGALRIASAGPTTATRDPVGSRSVATTRRPQRPSAVGDAIMDSD